MIISATDPTGGAGMGADIRICSALGTYPLPVVTAITAQNHSGVSACQPTDPLLLRAQIKAALSDFRPDAVKIGLLPSPESVMAVANALKSNNLENIVFDPVLRPTKGGMLIKDPDATIEAIKTELPDCINLITPNRDEYEDVVRNSDWRAVLVTGGDNEGEVVEDKLLMYGHETAKFSGPRIDSSNLHGTGCVYSSAIASFMARGLPMSDAIRKARNIMSECLRLSSTIECPACYGPALIEIPDFKEIHNG